MALLRFMLGFAQSHVHSTMLTIYPRVKEENEENTAVNLDQKLLIEDHFTLQSRKKIYSKIYSIINSCRVPQFVDMKPVLLP